MKRAFFTVLAGLFAAPFAAAAVPPEAPQRGAEDGNIFYEITDETGEGALSFLIGADSRGDICVKRKSLPPEINAVLDKADAAVFETRSSGATAAEILQERHSLTQFPEGGDALDLYIGKERAEKLFDFIQTVFSHDSATDRKMQEILKRLGYSLSSYSEMLRTTPGAMAEAVSFLIAFSKASDKEARLDAVKNAVADEEEYLDHIRKEDRQNCSSLETGDWMDLYLEKRTLCREKPVYSLETSLEERVLTQIALQSNNMRQGQELSRLIDSLPSDDGAGRGNGAEQPTEALFTALYFQWQEKVSDVQAQLFDAAETRFTEAAAADARRSLLDFFEDNESHILPSCQIQARRETERLVQSSLETSFKALYFQSHRAYMNLEPVSQSYDKANSYWRAAFKACFPFEPPQYILRQEAKLKALRIDLLKRRKAALLDSQDQNTAASLADVLNRERTVVAVTGAGRLPGVIKELRARGYEARPLAMSHDIIEAEDGCGI